MIACCLWRGCADGCAVLCCAVRSCGTECEAPCNWRGTVCSVKTTTQRVLQDAGTDGLIVVAANDGAQVQPAATGAGVCACYPGWSGPQCASADATPAKVGTGNTGAVVQTIAIPGGTYVCLLVCGCRRCCGER